MGSPFFRICQSRRRCIWQRLRPFFSVKGVGKACSVCQYVNRFLLCIEPCRWRRALPNRNRQRHIRILFASTFQTHLGLNARRLYRKTAVLSSSITIFPIKGLGICNGSNPKAAATAEIVYQIAERLHVPLKGDLATCLMLALSTDTGHFGFRNTTPRTLQMAAQLLDNGASIADVCYDVYHRKTLGKTKLLGRAIESLEIFCGGKAAMVTITNQDLLDCGCDQSDCEGLIDVAREIDGVEISLMLREKEDGIKGSLRSRNEINVADLAAQYGGGGHRAASGFTLKMTLPQAVDEVKQMLERTLGSR